MRTRRGGKEREMQQCIQLNVSRATCIKIGQRRTCAKPIKQILTLWIKHLHGFRVERVLCRQLLKLLQALGLEVEPLADLVGHPFLPVGLERVKE